MTGSAAEPGLVQKKTHPLSEGCASSGREIARKLFILITPTGCADIARICGSGPELPHRPGRFKLCCLAFLGGLDPRCGHAWRRQQGFCDQGRRHQRSADVAPQRQSPRRTIRPVKLRQECFWLLTFDPPSGVGLKIGSRVSVTSASEARIRVTPRHGCELRRIATVRYSRNAATRAVFGKPRRRPRGAFAGNRGGHQAHRRR